MRSGCFIIVATVISLLVSIVATLPTAALTGSYSWNQMTGISGGDQQMWETLSMSGNGARMAMGVYGGTMYASSNFGSNWTTTTRNWYRVDSSSDGTKLVASVLAGYLYTSTNSGLTWTERTNAGSRGWTSVTMSADGTKMAAIGDYIIYTSSDSGATWTEQQTPIYRSWTSLTMSADGTKLVVADPINDALATSYDSGVTWTEQVVPGGQNYSSVAMSSDGSKMIVGTFYGNIYTSADSGVTWVQQIGSGSRYWQAVAASSDATQIVAVDHAGPLWEGGSVYVSSDSGVTWTEQAALGTGFWETVTMNASGSRVAVAQLDGFVYTGTIANHQDTESFNMDTLVSPEDNTVSGAVLSVVSSPCPAIDAPSISVLSSSGVIAPEADVTIVGGIGFSLLCSTPGGSGDATIALGTYHADLSKIRVYKKIPNSSALQDITSEVNLSNQVLGAGDTTTISYTLIDGSDYDEDGIVNGVIVDPLYFGVASSATLADTGDNHMLILLLGVTFLFGSALTVLVYSSRM